MASRTPILGQAGVPWPEGLRYEPEFITPEEERRLLELFDTLTFSTVVMHGVPARRTVAHFGWRYGYEERQLAPADPTPGFLLPLRDRCGHFADLEPTHLQEVAVTRYPPGASIGWHRDAPMFGSRVVVVSFGGQATLRLRRTRAEGAERCALPLPARSVYLLSGAARWQWQHSLAPVTSLRYSVSFRTLKAADSPGS